MINKHPYCRLIPLVFCGLGLLVDAVAADKALDASQIGSDAVPLTEYFAVLEDPEHKLTLAEVQTPAIAAQFVAEHGSDQPLAYGTTTTPHWFRFRLQNPTPQPLQRIIEIDFPRISDIQLHQPLPDGSYQSLQTGAAYPFTTRPYANRNFVFPVSLPPLSEQTYYFRLQSNTDLLVPAQVWSPEAFQAHERKDYIIQAWYYGIATAMGLFNLLLFIALREKIYLLYVIFVATTVAAFASFFGLAPEFLWPAAGIWAEKAMSITAVFQATIFALFTRHMLNTPAIVPTLDRVLLLVVGTMLLLLLGDLASIPGAFILGQLFVLAVYVYIFAVAFHCVLHHERRAYFFVIAFTFYLLGVITYTLTSMGVLPHTQLTANAGQIGSGLEMLLLAFALADRFNMIRREKYQAQEEALQTKQTLLDSVRASERQLEARVAQRTEELNEAMRKLQDLSLTDGLTGIANRRQFDSVLSAEWKRAERAGAPLALAMLDVDHFKKFNDLYGHPQGDECLKQVARLLANNVSRPAELIARYGGEEFAVIVPGANNHEALQLALKICAALRACRIPHAGSEVGYITASIGVAVSTPQPGESPDTLIQAADTALYGAKAGGRNRVVVADPIPHGHFSLHKHL
ncbi:sensor domain-containing diguanylate cyclase [Pseudomonas sp. N040]|uniref:sensor domain-containing diguanylate cyclase n=1 Tax=Pseudomonas sp. N040 TaxID=2785325 RepID=UPI0018A2842E|nr:diguanylate cyclase [Pseudomonas sp. N040]MBF7729782.1 diguanylate cyclase [Pseudomonas sp. N040]MBW7013424.1 diguanylate cyclase [Pseudomonas sp. N040]